MSSVYNSPIFSNAAYTGSTSNTSSTSTAQSSSSGPKTLGEADFMTLLIAQLKNQDPLNPTDNTQFVSQLATFSALQQQTTMTQTLQQSTAVGLIGTTVQDSQGDKGVVQSVSNDSTNGLQLTINTTQTDSKGNTTTVPVQVKLSDITNISIPGNTTGTTGSNTST